MSAGAFMVVGATHAWGEVALRAATDACDDGNCYHRFPCIETLDLRGVAGLVRDDALAATPRISKLSTLVLDSCRHVTDDGLKQLSTSVQTLSLRHCSQVRAPATHIHRC
mgnify:CR=1 FL=1